MLEHYFIRPDTVDRILACWLGDAIQTYGPSALREGCAITPRARRHHQAGLLAGRLSAFNSRGNTSPIDRRPIRERSRTSAFRGLPRARSVTVAGSDGAGGKRCGRAPR